MRILLYDDTPAFLCHGGKQVHAQKMYENLKALGVAVEYARWWDPSQKCDLIHLFSCSPAAVWAAQQAAVKLVLTHIVDATSYSWAARVYRRLRNQAIRGLHSDRLGSLFPWYVLPRIDALVYLNKFDLETAISIYGVPSQKTHLIPNGCDANQIERLQLGPRNERSYLICMASIVPVKNSLLLATAARRANVPVVFLGKPFSEEDAYYQEFRKLVDGKRVIYPGYASGEDKVQWLTEASGFVLLSKHESGCLSVYEAAATGLPVLLSDLSWARAYGKHPAIQHVDLKDEVAIANRLKSFFATSRRLEGPTFPVMTWREVARQYIDVYQSVLDSAGSAQGA